jgi:eukaryotic-like serine/threonine-protein kinase
LAREDEQLPDTSLNVATALDLNLPARQLLDERFFLHRCLGAGGFGVVYEAEDLRDGGRVALKMLRHVEPEWLYRFKREFRALSGIIHPNLVVLDELFGSGDGWFFTMELIEGSDFVSHSRSAPGERPGAEASGVRQALALTRDTGTDPVGMPSHTQSAPFHEPRLRDTFRQLLDGLVVLHAADKVHRDIKPSNVLVTAAGRVVLIDFGLIYETRNTTDHCLIGTPQYMAPEQAASQEVGPSADLYGAGVMLYEALTGVRPIEGTPLQVLIDKQTRHVVPPASLVPGVPQDLNELCLELLRRDPRARPSALEARRRLDGPEARAVAIRGAAGDVTTFVGRHAELAALQGAFDTTHYGQSEVVLVSGQSGIGKTRLVGHFTARLVAEHSSVLLLEGRCHEREAIPYKALDGIVDALSRHLSRMPSGDIAAVLPTHRAMLTRIFPAFLRIPQLTPQRAPPLTSSGDHTALRDRAFLELRELFTRLAMSRPTVLCIDDLQWADEDGLRALAEILRKPDAPALLLIGTLRTSRSETGMTLDRLQELLPGKVRTLQLEALGDSDTLALAAALLGAGTRAGAPERIAVEASGHPLFVEELARHAALGTTASNVALDEMIWSRVLGLPPRAREIIELVSVAGKPLPQQVAADAAGLEPASFQQGAAALRASNLIRTGGAGWADTIETYHDRVRETVLERLHADRPQLLHRALARAFEASGTVDPETLAGHFRGAGEAARTAVYVEAAGDQAAAAFAFDQAATWFGEALASLPPRDPRRPTLHIKLGNALANGGRGAEAAPHFTTAAENAVTNEALALRHRAADQLLRSGHFDRGLEASRMVFASIGMRLPTTRLQTLLYLAFYTLLLRLRGLRFRQRPVAAIDAATRIQIDTCYSMAATLGFVDTIVGFVFQRRALLLALGAGHVERIGSLLAIDAAYTRAVSRRSSRRAERMLQLARDVTVQSGDVNGQLFVTAMSGLIDWWNGRFRAAAKNLNAAIHGTYDSSHGLTFERVTSRNYLIRTLALLGKFKQLRQCQEETLREALLRGDLYATVNLRIGFASLARLAEDRAELAESELHAAMHQWSTRGFHLEHYYALLANAWIGLYAGDAEKAYALSNELLRRSKRSLHLRLQTLRFHALYCRGTSALAMAEQGLGSRAQLLERASVDAHGIEAERMAWMLPFARVLRAGVALRRGNRVAALRELDAAVLEFAAGDMAAYADAASDRAARLRADATMQAELGRIAERFSAEGVVAPERMIRLLVPGLLATGEAGASPIDVHSRHIQLSSYE